MSMTCLRCVVVILFAHAGLAPPAHAQTPDADGFVPLFDGKTLKGWVNVNCAPGTFFVKDGVIITTGQPIGYLRTEKQYENFIVEFEWMHVNKEEVGNSGFFVWGDGLPAVGSPFTRGIEVQVLVNLTYTDKKTGAVTASSHGDVFAIQGATCKPDRPHPTGGMRCIPSENRAKGGGEWNHYKVIAKDGVIKLHVNGKEVSGVSECKPRKGYLALESEAAECHFRNLKIKELPSSDPTKELCADEAKGFTSLFTGLDLSGWTTKSEAKTNWSVKGGNIHFDGKRLHTTESQLRTEKRFGNAELIADFKFPVKKEAQAPCRFLLRDIGSSGMHWVVAPDGKWGYGAETRGEVKNLKPAGQWNRLHVAFDKDNCRITVNGVLVRVEPLGAGVPVVGVFGLWPAGEMDFTNVFVRELGK